MDHSPLVTELIRRRYSCRRYQTKPVAQDQQRALAEFLTTCTTGPLGTRGRFSLVAATESDRAALKGLGTYGFIKDPPGFIVGAVEKGLKAHEDYGYLMERAILYATGLGIGTCWLGGSFSKSSFAKKIVLTPAELMPAVASFGYPAEGHQDRIRRWAKAEFRHPPESMFFDGTFENPLHVNELGAYGQVLEAVRWAPSASNKQPWRIVRNDAGWHFYLERTPRYGKGSLVFSLLRLADLQRVDLGIAMCHFELIARSVGKAGSWVLDEPTAVRSGDRTEYTATWRPDR